MADALIGTYKEYFLSSTSAVPTSCPFSSWDVSAHHFQPFTVDVAAIFDRFTTPLLSQRSLQVLLAVD